MQTKHKQAALSTLLKRFVGYLSGDSLNYLLGFVIYAWLVRSLTNQQYGYLSIATSIYQPLVMFVALGLDLIGPRVLAEHSGDLAYVVGRVQSLRIKFAFGICLPVVLLTGVAYWRAHQVEVTVVLIAAFSMVVARAFDVGYVAIALARPKPLVYSRAFGLLLYLIILVVCGKSLSRHLWTIPMLNAVGVTVGRIALMRSLRLSAFVHLNDPRDQSRSISWRLFLSGAKTSTGQLILFSFQTLDVVLVNRYADAGTVGQYAMIGRLYVFGTAVLACVLNAYFPELMAASSRSRLLNGHRKFMISSVGIGLLGGLAFYFLGGRIAELLGGRSLQVVHRIAPVYALVFLAMSVANPFLSFLPSLQREREYLGCVIVGGIAGLCMDFVLLPRFGVVGAAWGQLMGTLVWGLSSAYFVTKQMREEPAPCLADAEAIVTT